MIALRPEGDAAQPHENDCAWALAYADLGCVTVLDIVGRRLTRELPRSARHAKSPVRELDTWQRHTVIDADGIDVDKLLDEAFRFMNRGGTHADCIRSAARRYVRQIITARQRYELNDLARAIHEEGCLEAA